MPTKVAIIPARGGSTRFKDKNIALLGGKPLICWSVEAVLNSGEFDDVYVSTDSDKIFDAVNKGNIGLIDNKKNIRGVFEKAQEVVLRAIVILSNQTHVKKWNSEEMGITVYDPKTKGQNIHPAFEDLHKEGKLVFWETYNDFFKSENERFSK